MGKNLGNSLTGAWARGLAVTLCAVPVLVGATACRDIFAAPPCMPPEFSVSPSAAKPGDQVTVSAPDTTCDARYGADARVQVQLLDPYGTTVLEELAPMTDDGGFTFVFTVPAGVAPGKAGVTAYPYGVDWCDDTGVNNRAGAGPQTLVGASCAQRLVPLVVLGPGG
ncbi:hypothetical protein GU243_14815 [Pseudarthrobacter psychrotolerans]|uniref:Uncharacterized protein n=1 Tax=Pseudarthrobacter psychrotolerans TaxID=2697569 RepID=A0A6P1NQV0_9MICC|nr:hypothetical protein [Pseudarthrobacter psychrotolerans]QHK20780.1 hypothetical protein GU243_14815 [Pseudarthrobacter psychrotolerans]